MATFDGMLPGTGLLPAPQARSICQIRTRFGGPSSGSSKRGSGFLVLRRNGCCFVATAAHVLYDDTHGLARSVEVRIGQTAAGAAQIYTINGNVADNCLIPDGYRDSNPHDNDYDFAVIRIANDLAGFYCFDVSSVEPVQSLVRLYGYPMHANSAQTDTPHHAIFEVVAVDSEGFEYAHLSNAPTGQAGTPVVTYEGLSGGPLVGNSSTNETNRAFGIHTRGGYGIRAVRFSSRVRAEIRNWAASVS
ncbi:MAG: trypsin-like serine peptidase [Novosphingobium sp.]